jgi:hypothetical protein
LKTPRAVIPKPNGRHDLKTPGGVIPLSQYGPVVTGGGPIQKVRQQHAGETMRTNWRSLSEIHEASPANSAQQMDG